MMSAIKSKKRATVILTVTGFLEGAGVAPALVGAGVVGFLVGLAVGVLVGLDVGFLEGAGVAPALVGAGVVGFLVGLSVGFLEGAGVALAVVGAAVMALLLLRHAPYSLQKLSPMTPLLFSQANLALQLPLPMLAALL
jgi:hypothetical protein